MQRGEVWWADLPTPVGRRPVLLLSRNAAYRVRNAITVAEVTRTVWGLPVEVPLDTADGMPYACVVNLDTLVTIPKRLLQKRICALTGAKMQMVNDAIKYALNIQ